MQNSTTMTNNNNNNNNQKSDDKDNTTTATTTTTTTTSSGSSDQRSIGTAGATEGSSHVVITDEGNDLDEYDHTQNPYDAEVNFLFLFLSYLVFF